MKIFRARVLVISRHSTTGGAWCVRNIQNRTAVEHPDVNKVQES